MLTLGQTFIRASIYAGSAGTPAMTPQGFRQLRIVKNLWQPGEPCKLFKTPKYLPIKRALLYQLSYAPTFVSI